MVKFTQPISSNDAEIDAAALTTIPRVKSSGHSVTLIEPVAAALFRKRIDRTGKVHSAGNARLVKYEQLHFDTLEELHTIIIENMHDNVAMIRGEPFGVEQSGREDGAIRRQIAGDRNGRPSGKVVGFADVAQAYLVMDIDGVATPVSENWLEDSESAIEAVIYESMPPHFHDVSFVWHWTGTHGIGKHWAGALDPSHMRFRLYFLLDKPLTDSQCRAWLTHIRKSFPEVDPAINGTVQMNYIARPLMPYGEKDPLDGLPLSGFVERSEDLVTTPPPNRLDGAKVLRNGSRETLPYVKVESVEQALMGIGHNIRGPLIWGAAGKLVEDSPIGPDVDVRNAAYDVLAQLRQHVLANKEVIEANLAAGGRSWAEVENYLDNEHHTIVWLYENRQELGSDETGREPVEASYPINPVSLEVATCQMEDFFVEFREKDIPATKAWLEGQDHITRELKCLQTNDKLKGPAIAWMYDSLADILSPRHTQALAAMLRISDDDKAELEAQADSDEKKLRRWTNRRRKELREDHDSLVNDRLQLEEWVKTIESNDDTELRLKAQLKLVKSDLDDEKDTEQRQALRADIKQIKLELTDNRRSASNRKQGPAVEYLYQKHRHNLSGWHTRELNQLEQDDPATHKRLFADIADLNKWIDEREAWRQKRIVELEDKLQTYPAKPKGKLLQVTAGGGKTTQALVQLLPKKDADDGQEEDGSAPRLVILQPTHKLARQTKDDIIEKTSASPAVIKGYDRPVEDDVDDDSNDEQIERMCLRVSELRETQYLGASIKSTMCKREVDGNIIECQYFSECQKQRNRKDVVSADTVVAMHAHAFLGKPDEVGSIDGLVVDEDPSLSGIGTQNLKSVVSAGLPIEQFGNVIKPKVVSAIGKITDSDPGEIQRLWEKVVQLWKDIGRASRDSFAGTDLAKYLAHAPLQLTALDEVLFAETQLNAITDEYILEAINYHSSQIKIAEALLRPDITGRAREKVINNIRHIVKDHRKRAGLLRAILTFMRAKDEDGKHRQEAGNLLVVVDQVASHDGQGRAVRGSEQLVMKLICLRHQALTPSWANENALLLMSATPSAPEILEKIIGQQLEPALQIDIENAPGVKLRWFSDVPVSSNKLGLSDRNPQNIINEHGMPINMETRNRFDLARVVNMRLDHYRKILVVTKKSIANWLGAHFDEMGWSKVGLHFVSWGEIEGLNAFEGFRYMMVIGTKDVGSDEIRLEAAALTGHHYSPDNPAYDSCMRSYGLQMRDGTVEELAGSGYEDAFLQSLFDMHVVSKISQAIYRLRISRPKEHDRLIEVFANVAAPVIVDEVVEWGQMVESAKLWQLLNDKGLPDSAVLLAKHNPDLFANEASAGLFLKSQIVNPLLDVPDKSNASYYNIYKEGLDYPGTSKTLFKMPGPAKQNILVTLPAAQDPFVTLAEIGAKTAGDDYDPAMLYLREQALDGVVQLSTRHLRVQRPDIPKGKLTSAVNAFEPPAGHISIRYKKPGEKSKGALASASHNVDAAAILTDRLGYEVEAWTTH